MSLITAKTGTVVLVNGRARVRHTLTQPASTVNNYVDLNIADPIDAHKRHLVPKATIVTPPVVVPPAPVYSPINFLSVIKNSDNRSGTFNVAYNTTSGIAQYSGTKLVSWKAIYMTSDNVTRGNTGDGNRQMAHGANGEFTGTFTAPVATSGTLRVHLYIDGSWVGSDSHSF